MHKYENKFSASLALLVIPLCQNPTRFAKVFVATSSYIHLLFNCCTIVQPAFILTVRVYLTLYLQSVHMPDYGRYSISRS